MTSNFQFISLKDVYGIDTKSLAEFIRRGAASTENDENVSTNNIEDVFDKNWYVDFERKWWGCFKY